MTEPHIEHELPGGLDHSKLLALLGYNLAQASVPTLRIFDSHIGKSLGVTQVEFSILVLLHSNPGATGKQLCQALATAPARMSLLLDRLGGRDLIARVQSDVDKRVQHLRLSRSGESLVQKALAIASTMEADLLHNLSKGERTVLMELLFKIATSGRVRNL
ncbi:MAG: MarR family transcriptional regulator [Proteobacteria bacterium]|nr:MarR family transcriptional regulator [Pseudomonadota bacterium]